VLTTELELGNVQPNALKPRETREDDDRRYVAAKLVNFAQSLDRSLGTAFRQSSPTHELAKGEGSWKLWMERLTDQETRDLNEYLKSLLARAAICSLTDLEHTWPPDAHTGIDVGRTPEQSPKSGNSRPQFNVTGFPTFSDLEELLRLLSLMFRGLLDLG
jgi:hypothetical protein